MKAISFLVSVISILLILSLSLANNSIHKLIIFWFLFNIFIGYIETIMFVNQEYMSEKKQDYDKNPNFYSKDYSLNELIKKDFIIDGFLEYVRLSGDTRYTETYKKDFVTWVEMVNAFIAFITSIFIIFGLSTKKIDINIIAIIILIVSSMQLYGTVVYFLSYYTKIYRKIETKDAKWFIHLVLFNAPWIIIPIILGIYSINIILNNKIYIV